MTTNRIAYGDLSLSASNTNSFKVDFGGAAQPVSGTITVGTFPDNEPFNGAADQRRRAVDGDGASGTGVQRVTLANDSPARSRSRLATANIGDVDVLSFPTTNRSICPTERRGRDDEQRSRRYWRAAGHHCHDPPGRPSRHKRPRRI